MIFWKFYEYRMRNKVTNPFFSKLFCNFGRKKFEENTKTEDHHMMIVGAKELISLTIAWPFIFATLEAT